MKNFFKKHKKLLIVLLIVAAAVIAALVVAAHSRSARKDSSKSSLNTETIKRRTIVTSVSGTGTVVSVNKEEVSTDLTGMKVKSVEVSEGDTVTAGQVIAYLDDADLQENKQDLESTRQDTIDSQTQQNADYNQQITDNQQNRADRLNDLNQQLTETTNDYNDAVTDRDTTQSQYNEQKASYDQKKADGKDTPVDLQALTSLEASLNTKKTRVDTLKSQIDSINDQISNIQQEDDSTITDAQKDYNDSVKDTLDSNQDQIDNVQKQIDKCTVTSSIAGVVTSVNVKAGDDYNGTTIAVVQNDDAYQIEAQINEYDIPDVSVGQAVKIKTDATRDEELDGTVSFVAPSATDQAGDSLNDITSLTGMDMSSLGSGSQSDGATYEVKIDLAQNNDRLRLGMTANVSIITASADNVWSVPYEAVQTDKQGQKYIEVLDESQTASGQKNAGTSSGSKTASSSEQSAATRRIDVTTGLEGTYYTEVSSDELKKGLKVVVPKEKGSNDVDQLLNMMGSDGGVK